MKNGFLTLLTGILSCPLFAYAQKSATSSITGQVADSASHKPLEYATITLLKAAGLQPVMNTLTDSKGRFRLNGVSAGRYRIGISIKGYTPLILDAFSPDTLHPTELPVSYVSAAPRQLEQVTISGQKPLVEIKDDKLVYNVEHDMSRDVLTAAEILRKVPLVTVDPDGNIQLKGSNNFKVLLNGKGTSIMARNPKEALRSFPASLIKTIEVIAQPSARYDAEGAAGIINIITKQRFSGHNGTVFGNYNTRNFSGGGASLNAKLGKLGIGGYLGTSYFRNNGRTDGRRESYVPGNHTTLLQSSTSKFDGTYYYGNLELSYDLDSTSSLSLYSNLDIGRNSNRSPQVNLLYDSLQALIQTGNYTAFTKYRNNSYDVGLDYQKKFRRPGQAISLSLNRNAGNDHMNTDNSQANEPGNDLHVFNHNDEEHTETTFQLDYAQPLPHQQLLETGAKAILRSIESDYDQRVETEGVVIRGTPNRTDIFNYKQDVLALYTTYRFKVKNKLNVQLGARLEQTYIDASFISGNTALSTDYLSFIPTVSFSLPLTQTQVVSLAYSRRLQRPWVWNLNPYVNDNDPNNLLTGNPDLEPEFNHSLMLGYNGLVKGARLTLSTDHTFTNNAIESYTTIDEETDITTTTYANIGKRSATGFNLNTNFKPGQRWQLLLNMRAMYTRLRADQLSGLRNDGWSGTGYLSADYDLGKGFKTAGTLSVNTSKLLLQGRSPGYTTHTLTLHKTLFHQQATVSLHLDQPFQKEIAWKSVIHDPSFYRANTFYYPVRAVRVGFNWKFGQLKETISRKKGVHNNDIKQNESSRP